MKKTNKTFKPAYTVDMTKASTAEDLFLEFVIAKVNAGIAITGEELKHVVEHFVDDAIDKATTIATTLITTAIILDNSGEKKLPWYKRFWNWIIRKNK